MNFKAWLQADETVLGSDGMRDNQSTQTNQATDLAADTILKDKAFAPFQSKVTGMGGTPSAQRDQLIDFTTKGLSSTVPKDVSSLTTTPKVAFMLQNKMGLKNVVPKPKMMVKR